MTEEERIPWWRYVVAGAMGFSLLGLTYALFDPDLGTPVPLFQEFTCTGRLAVTATDGYGASSIRAPQTGLVVSAKNRDALWPAYFVVYRREGGGGWDRYLETAGPTGQQSYVLSNIESATETYVRAMSLDGEVCAGRSGILRVEGTSGGPTFAEPPPEGALR